MVMTKQMICDALCGELQMREVPAGYAVHTPFAMQSGDNVGFYLVRNPSNSSQWRFEDSGLIIPIIEANGVSLDSGMRSDAFARLLDEYGAEFDDDTRELHSEYMSEQDIINDAPRFVSLLLRMQDFELLHPDTVANTFREDVENAITQRFSNIAKVEFRARLSDHWDNYVADAIIQPSSGDALVVYLATSESKVDEAVLMHWDLRAKGNKNPVALIMESTKPVNVSARALRRAMNRLEAVSVFRGDEGAAIDKLASQIGIVGTS